jgi:hypothetical protein
MPIVSWSKLRRLPDTRNVPNCVRKYEGVRDPRLMRFGAVLCLGCVLMTSSCGGGGGQSNSANANGLSGNWQMTLTGSGVSSGIAAESGFLMQSGSSLAGNIVLSGVTACPGLGTASGTVTGSDVAITVGQVDQTLTLTGAATSDGTSMAGEYSILASGCGSSSVGTFTATQVKPLGGSFQATFTSGEVVGEVYTFGGSLTQGPNTGMSYATLAGTMTSTNAPCINSFSIAGEVGGTSVVFNFLASDGSAQGQYRGTTTTDGTTLTGTYDFLAQSNGCSGDAGTVSITFQPSSM